MQQQTETTFAENKNIFHCWWHFVRWHFVRDSNAERLRPELQSAYRAHHSTETTVTKVLASRASAVQLWVGSGRTSTVALNLFAVASRHHNHHQLRVEYHRDQSLVLGPILFLLYTADLLLLIESHNLRPHAFADDTQHQIPKVPMRVGEDLVVPAIFVRDLGIYLDSGATMRTHVSKTVSCFFSLHFGRSAAFAAAFHSSTAGVSLSCHGSITAAPHLLVFQQTQPIGCSPCWTPPHDFSTPGGGTTMWCSSSASCD